MNKLYALLGLGVLASASYGTVVNFDDLATDPPLNALVPSSYAGFNWGNSWGVLSNADYTHYYDNHIEFPSLNNAVYNAYGVMSISMSGNQPFNFKGAQVTTFAVYDRFNLYSSKTLTIDGYNGGNLIYTKTVNLSPTEFQWFDADYQNIDQLVFSSDEDVRWWVLDDFTYEAGEPSVPGPAAVLPFALGLLAMRRRRR